MCSVRLPVVRLALGQQLLGPTCSPKSQTLSLVEKINNRSQHGVGIKQPSETIYILVALLASGSDPTV